MRIIKVRAIVLYKHAAIGSEHAMLNGQSSVADEMSKASRVAALIQARPEFLNRFAGTIYMGSFKPLHNYNYKACTT